ncbi:hypothetical protein [Lacicoccus alkaliphilus]|uniref:Uncharacterized protein n=1 Tax=Lacicoccus alkaliphilus DSM 16010 TaxID=1123231 RepID=A0A1M7IFN5_9BACL|nr:hypothetical protein [Salinicoccus alkaliphilus]SHM39584.1 hypothetical protein SAMN02745189_02082 [Salinicoccus alkaliphilus DSM 16010]
MKPILLIGGGVLLGFLLIFTGIGFFPDSFAFNFAASVILIISLVALFGWLYLNFIRPSGRGRDENG